jgi:hypothetical protein
MMLDRKNMLSVTNVGQLIAPFNETNELLTASDDDMVNDNLQLQNQQEVISHK